MATRRQAGAVPLYTLLARDSELETLIGTWRQSRLVTLYGQSGVGKSALARAAADGVSGEAPAAVVRLDAEGLTSPLAVLRLLARARRRRPHLLSPDPLLRDEPSRAAALVMADGLAGSTPPPFFVLLDHLSVGAHAAARGIVQWLVEHPHLHLLVVSRRPMEVLGEQTMCLAPLSISGSDGAPSPAGQLFCWHAGLGAREDQVGVSSAAEEICAALDGLPAGIEAAGALVGALPMEEVVRIAGEEPLSLSLRGTLLQRVLQATWDDLFPEAREYLRANAVWPGSFSDQAGQYMRGLAGGHAVTARLVQMGLLRLTASEQGQRYRLSPLVRHLALAEPMAEGNARRERMARWLAEEALHVARSRGVWSSFQEEAPAVRWAWRFLAGRGDGATVSQMALALGGPLRRHLGRPAEAAELLRSALAWARVEAVEQVPALQSQLAATERILGHLERAEERLRGLLAAPLTTRERMLARLRLAAVLSDRGQHAAALQMRGEAVAELREGRPDGRGGFRSEALAWALHGEAVDHFYLGEYEAVRAAVGDAGPLFDQSACADGRAACRTLLALLHVEAGELEEAAWQAREAVELASAVEDQPGRARALEATLAVTARADPARALELVVDIRSLWQQIGHPAGLIRSHVAAAEPVRSEGLPGDHLIQPLREGLASARRRGYRGLEAACLVALAETYRHLGKEETARDYWQQARAACDQTDCFHVRRQCEALGTALRSTMPQRRDRRSVLRSSAVDRVSSSSSGPPLMIYLMGTVKVVGPNGVISADGLRPKEQRILARLGLQPGRVVLRDELLETFWPGSKMVLAERSLRTVVSSLRSAMRSVLHEPAPPLIRGRMDGYCLEEAACAVDVSRFVEAVQEARAGSGGDEPSDRALVAWQRAVDLYQGDLLSAFRYDDWCLAIRERLRDDCLDGLYQLARAAVAAGSLERARELGTRMVELEPAEERAHRLLMRCHALLGRPAEAVRQFERCRAALDEELGASPAAATKALLEEIRSGAGASMLEDSGERTAFT